jgi:parvulin-like peptidyl-prolyl isomerase
VQGLGFAPAVNEAALAAEQGDLVGPVETPQGPVLFEVTERRGFDAEELASQTEEIRARLAQERFDRLIYSLILERKRQEGGIRPSRQLQEQIGGGAAGPA